MLNLMFSDPFTFILIFGGMMVSIGLHEASHCYTADYLGDPTPRSMGRVTLNPIAHLDLIGTLMILTTGVFGWGKSSPFDPYNLKDPKRDTALIAFAGPASNLVIAILLALIIRFVSLPASIIIIIISLIQLNITLALFNLIPVAPLDGSKIAGIFMSNESAVRFSSQQNLMLLFLLILPIFSGSSIASIIVSPIANVILHLLLPV
jgi:Zn-dependent protease